MLDKYYKNAIKLEDTEIDTYKAPTIFEVWEEFYKERSETETAETIKYYKNSFNKIYTYNFRIDEATKRNYNEKKEYKIKKILTEFISKNRKNRIVNNHIRQLGTFLKWCMEKGYIPNISTSKLIVKFPEKDV